MERANLYVESRPLCDSVLICAMQCLNSPVELIDVNHNSGRRDDYRAHPS